MGTLGVKLTPDNGLTLSTKVRIVVDTVYVKQPLSLMPFAAIFSAVNSAALLCWLALVLLPRWPAVRITIQFVVVAGLCTLYAVLIAVYFAHFSDRGRWFQRDRGRCFRVTVDDHGSTRVKGSIVV